MQIIQQVSLRFQSGRSVKLYEVDLSKLGEDQYVVNFRYGRQGKPLKEGSKTVAALPLAMAQRIFDQLVEDKIRKGYQTATGQDLLEAGIPPSTDTAVEPLSSPTDPDAGKQVILDRLTTAVNQTASGTAQGKKHWPVGRVIWRAGELKIKAAAPLLVRLIGNDVLQNYSIAWALGQCGDESAIAPLEAIYRNSSTPDHVRRIALEALFKLADDAKCQALKEEIIVTLPPDLRQLVRQGPADRLTTVLAETLEQSNNPRDFEILDKLYQIDSEYSRPALLGLVKTAPFAPNYFQRLRHIFKIAEYRQDAQLFGALAYRFDIEVPGYSNNTYQVKLPDGQYLYRDYQFNPQTGQWDYNSSGEDAIQLEQRRSDTRLAYSDKTQRYFLRRVWRTLRKLGQLDDPAYVHLAGELLLQYSDANAVAPRETVAYQWDWRNGYTQQEVRRANWDAFASYLTLNHLLYENSPRYGLKPAGRAWQCKSTYKPGDPEPQDREEAFPDLWNAQPEVLLKLLLESACQPVHQFAVKALRSCTDFCQALNLETLIQLLNRGYEVTAEFGFELARDRYQPNQPNSALVLAVANCAYAPARTAAHLWIAEQRDRFLQDVPLMVGLVLSPHADTRTFVRGLLSRSIMADSTARSLLGQIIAKLLTFNAEQASVMTEVSETLLLCFSPQLRQLGLEIILDLLRHPLPDVQEFGARLLLNHETQVVDLPEGLLDALLASPFDAVRVIGVRLLGQLPESLLIQRTQLLITLATHPQPEMREAIRPSIQRLAAQQLDFCRQIGPPLLAVLAEPEPHEGIHSSIIQLLSSGFSAWMQSLDPELVWQLLDAEFSAAHDVAGQILQKNASVWSQSLPTAQMSQLTHHEVLAVRQAGQQMLQEILPRLRQNPEDLLAAVVVLESKWEDARAFGFELFRNRLQSQDFTPAIVISICDNTQAEVRKLGRELVSRCFQDQEGQSFLLKFSEHPSMDMQLFATQYLSDHVAGNETLLRELSPYFVRVLGQVNRGRVTKQRIFAFLEAEATKSEAAAQIVAEILTRQSASIAIGDRAHALATLLKIHRHYPDLSLPIQVKPVAVRQVS